MSVLQMQRISICAMKKDRKAILKDLQGFGAIEIETSKAGGDGLTKMDTLEDRQKFEKRISVLEQALDVLQEKTPEKTSMFSSLEGKKLVEQDEYSKVVADHVRILEAAGELIALRKKQSEALAETVRLQTQKEILRPWLALDIPMSFEGTKAARVFIGSIGSVLNQDEIAGQIAEYAPDLSATDIEIVSKDKDQTCLTVVCLREEADRMEEALRAAGFAKPVNVPSGIPAEEIQKIDARLDDIRQEIHKITGEIIKKSDERSSFKLLSDYYRMKVQRYEALSEMPQTKQTFVLSGYIPAKLAGKISGYLNEKYSLFVEVKDLEEEEEAPVLLENGKAAGSVEGVLASFGLPAKGEMDPTKIMFIFYVVLFGMMLSDAAYGLIVSVACFVLLKKYPRMSESMSKSLRMFMYCGISTLVWGILFGGYFGDVVDVVSGVFFGHEVSIPALWFIPLNDPMRLLIFSMLLGMIHLFTGLGIKGYMCIRDKRYLDFFCDVVLWYLLLIGLILMLLPSSLFYSISQMTIVFPPALQTLSKGLAIIGAVGILLMSGRSSKNPGLRIALGAYDLYNITGWLSDVLSYSRLLALGLATGVIASVVNQMGSMAGKGIFGAIVFIIVFIIGHVFNLAINLLGAYVHTNRLQYVEFFGKFYEGGGREFHPLRADTKYVDIKEETK